MSSLSFSAFIIWIDASQKQQAIGQSNAIAGPGPISTNTTCPTGLTTVTEAGIATEAAKGPKDWQASATVVGHPGARTVAARAVVGGWATCSWLCRAALGTSFVKLCHGKERDAEKGRRFW